MTTKPPAGSDLARLTAARDRLEAVLHDPNTSPRDLATVSREYRLLVEKIGALSPSSASSPLDEIAAKRSKRKGA